MLREADREVESERGSERASVGECESGREGEGER